MDESDFKELYESFQSPLITARPGNQPIRFACREDLMEVQSGRFRQASRA